MRKVLIPMDGSRNAMRALDYVLGLDGREALRVQLIYVHFVPPFFANSSAYLRRDENRGVTDKCARAALGPAVRKLARAGVAHRTMVKLGDAAPEIARAAARMNCESIVMGSRGMGAIKSLVLGSTAMKVIHLASTPVTIVK
jgi:nucleotide-binding universal stress UspA family protein